MSFPKYPKYKDSGVEWLGEVPEGWEVRRLKNIVDEPLKYGANESAETDDRNLPRFIRITDIDNCGGLKDDTFKSLPMNIAEQYLLIDGDILLARSGATVGKSFIYSQQWGLSCFAGYLIRARLKIKQCLPKWVYYFCQTDEYWGYVIGTQIQSTIQNVSAEKYANLYLPLPPLLVQTFIATFLDQETAKIDTLVSEQKRLIELLKEKRQAVISHAVTKGLNPEVPMKDSGVEWLGEVPEHWEVLPLKRLVSSPITDGPHETPKFIDHGVPFISAEAISSGSIDFSKIRACISEEDNTRYSLKYSPKLHDIYMIKSGATTGITAIVEDRIDFNIWSPLAAIRCNSGSIPHFVLNFMRSRHFLEAVTLYWSFGTQQNIGMGVIENLFCTVPPLEEQVVIAQHLTRESAKIDTLTTEAHRAIALLQERRTALISAAVTGQIDVRNYVNKAVL